MSIPLPPDDPAQSLLRDGFTSTPTAYLDDCYICRDPEFAQMGLPLCRYCLACKEADRNDGGHVPADDVVCSYCGFNEAKTSTAHEREGE